MKERRVWPKELAVGIDRPWERAGKPVKRHRVKHLVQRRVIVSPLLELFANPVQSQL